MTKNLTAILVGLAVCAAAALLGGALAPLGLVDMMVLNAFR